MRFIDTDQRPVISLIVRVDEITSVIIPAGSFEYGVRQIQEQLSEVTVECTGIQGSKSDSIPVRLTFSLGLTVDESDQL